MLNKTDNAMKTILLPTDFSLNAKHAADFAVSLAGLIDAKIILLHAYESPVSTTPFVLPLPQQGLMQEALEETRTLLAQTKEDMQAKYGEVLANKLETKLVFGNPVDNILEAAAEVKADFLVIGSLGEGGILANLFGSTALSIAQKSTIPVWIIPQQSTIQAIKEVIYASDLEGDEVGCINKIINMGELLGINHTKLVHVKEYLSPEVFPSSEIIDLLEEEFGGEKIIFRNLYRDDTIVGIDKYIRNQKPDAVILAQRPKGFVEKLFHESIIKHLTLSSQIPLLVLQKKY